MADFARRFVCPSRAVQGSLRIEGRTERLLAPEPDTAQMFDMASHDAAPVDWDAEKQLMQKKLAQTQYFAMGALSLALVACCGVLVLQKETDSVGVDVVGPTELAFDHFEETLKVWDSNKAMQTFATGATIRFYNQGTKEEKLFYGQSGAVDLLEYATSLGCARIHDHITVRDVDEAARMVYIAWDYPAAVTNFCRPSAEMYLFDSSYKIVRLNTLVDWRKPLENPTSDAFAYFTKVLKTTWDRQKTAETFAEDAVVRFYNQGTGELKYFYGREGAVQLLDYAASLGCAKLHDDITVREVDEVARFVYVAWSYPAPQSTFCGNSAELYTFDRDYKIWRLNTLVDWRLPRENATADAFNEFEALLDQETWDYDKISELFSEDAGITFYNSATQEQRNFTGKEGARGLLDYANSLGCANMDDVVTLRKVDEVSRTVYIAWDYPGFNSSTMHCGASAEMYTYDKQYKIYRINALVDWKAA